MADVLKVYKLRYLAAFPRAVSFIVIMISLISSGCSVFMAAQQPEKKDLSIIKIGNSRDFLIGEFGAPEWSGDENGAKVDIYKFVQGYSTGAKTSRALLHGTADIFTLGLWEVVGTPVETVANGSNLQFKIIYGADNKVKTIEGLNEQTQKILDDMSKKNDAKEKVTPK